MTQVTKQDILNDLQLTKKVLQEVEFYIRNYTSCNTFLVNCKSFNISCFVTCVIFSSISVTLISLNK